jgi:hypothetical protein
MLRSLLPTALLLCAAYHTADADAQASRAARMTSVSPAHCLSALERRESPDLVRCPTVLRAAVEEARETCVEAGGKLQGAAEGDVWALDVDGDGRSELAFELDGNVSCADAWSVFSCGSLGCPKQLYALRDGAWTVVGSLSASSPEQVTLSTARSADGHRTLEVCPRDGCPERWIYEWQGESYEATRAEVRGTRVDVSDSVHGLYPLKAATTVRAAPRANGTAVGDYEAGIEVAIIGTVEGGDWYYVSPCNACDSGFVARSAVTIP